MTDQEIIALVESKLPQELSLEEIDLIRRRMRASPIVPPCAGGAIGVGSISRRVDRQGGSLAGSDFRRGGPIAPVRAIEHPGMARLDGLLADDGLRGGDVGVGLRHPAARQGQRPQRRRGAQQLRRRENGPRGEWRWRRARCRLGRSRRFGGGRRQCGRGSGRKASPAGRSLRETARWRGEIARRSGRRARQSDVRPPAFRDSGVGRFARRSPRTRQRSLWSRDRCSARRRTWLGRIRLQRPSRRPLPHRTALCGGRIATAENVAQRQPSSRSTRPIK